MSRQSRELKKQQERAKKYGCDGRCYWSTGMCPSVEICDETRVGEAIATAIGLITVPLPEPTKEISVIEHQCSYGSIMNLLEIWADGSIQGYLSAKQTLKIIERIKARESKKRREMRCRKSTKNWRTIDQY